MIVTRFMDLFDRMRTSGRWQLWWAVYGLFALAAFVGLADVLPDEIQVLLLSQIAVAFGFLASITTQRLRGELAARAVDLLPLALLAADLAFVLLTLPVRFFAAPARARPRPAAGRLGRLPAITLSPRLLPIPSFTRA